MRRHRRDPGLDQRRRDQRSHDDIDADRRHAHAEQDAERGGNDEQEHDAFLSDCEQLQRQPEGEAGDVEDADEHARDRADHDEVDHRAAGGDRRAQHLADAVAVSLVAENERAEDERRGRKQCAVLGAHIPAEQRSDQDCKRDGEVPAGAQHRSGVRKVGDGLADDAALGRFQVDLEE